MRLAGGSAGLLRDGKTTTYVRALISWSFAFPNFALVRSLAVRWEGGIREPGLIHWPGKILPGVSTAVVATYDIFATALALAGVPLPSDRYVDGVRDQLQLALVHAWNKLVEKLQRHFQVTTAVLV